MAECSNSNSQQVSGAFPETQRLNSGALDVNLLATSSEIFNPNLALAAVQTFNTMNNIANKMFGIDARWFRAVPQQRSKDVIFKEYTLSCVEDTPICLKVIVPEGRFPESDYPKDLMGLEYNIPTEIQIDKKYWEEMSGFGTAPQKKDIVYLPLPNKLFQVESSYLKRGFMEQETTWIINLIKYQPEASRKEGDKLKETIDKYTVSEDSLFGEMLNSDIEKLTDKMEMSPFSSTSEDKYKDLDKSLKIIQYNLNIWGIMVSESAYDLNTSSIYNAIKYKNSSDIIKTSNDRSLTAWVCPKLNNSKPIDVIWMQPDETLSIPANFKIKIAGRKRYGIGDTFVIWRTVSQNIYATVTDNSYAAMGVYWCKIDQKVIDHLNSIQYEWWDKSSWKLLVSNPINIIDGINETETGFSASIYANQYIKVKYGTQEHISILDKKLDTENWYGIVINIGNSWGQYNVYVWRVSPNDDIQKLNNIFYETLSFTPEETIVNEYSINKSDSYITNIRLFNSTIEEERQINELLSYFTSNADKALILDSADSKLRIPYISQQK